MKNYKVRFLGDNFIGGSPRIRQIDIRHPEGHMMTLHNHQVFPGQDADGTYILGEEIVELNLDLLSDKRRFICEYVEGTAEEDAVSDLEVTEELAEESGDASEGGIHLANPHACPTCRKTFASARALRMHKLGAKHGI